MEKANKSGENANNPFAKEEEISENAMIVAEAFYDQFLAFMKVGFSKPEAFRLIQTIIANSIKGGN